jgi:hypothetical protein
MTRSLSGTEVRPERREFLTSRHQKGGDFVVCIHVIVSGILSGRDPGIGDGMRRRNGACIDVISLITRRVRIIGDLEIRIRFESRAAICNSTGISCASAAATGIYRRKGGGSSASPAALRPCSGW